jgi:hypothetical protein
LIWILHGAFVAVILQSHEFNSFKEEYAQHPGLTIMKEMPAPKKSPLTTETVQRMLRKVPSQEAFYFSRGIGDYTGQAATTLTEFAEMLRTVDSKAIEFHMERKDFERWIRNVFGDEELAQTVSRIAGSHEKNRRKELVMVTTKRLDELRNLLKTQ